MSKKLSIKIGSRKIFIVEAVKSKNGLSILKHFSIDAPKNCVEDAKILDLEMLSKTIKNSFSTHKIKAKNVSFVINTSSVIMRTIKSPYIQNFKDAMSMIKFELEQSMPIDTNKYHYIYRILDTYIEDGVKYANYSVYGIENEMIANYLSLAESLRLNPEFVDLSFNNLSYIYKNELLINDKSITNDRITGFVDFGYRNTAFSVLHDGVNDFSRVIRNGYKEVEDSLIEQFSMTKEDILKFVENTSLLDDNKTDSIRVDTIKTYLNIIIDELNRYIKYYISKSKDTQIEKIYIYGVFSNIKDFDIYLSRKLGVDITIVQSLSSIKMIEKNNDVNDFFTIREYLDNLLALYYVNGDINFLTEISSKHKVKFNKFFAAITSGAIIGLTVLYFMLVYFNEIKFLSNENEKMKQFLDKESNKKLLEQSKILSVKVASLQEVEDKLFVINKEIISNDIVSVDIIKSIASCAPNDTYITSMSIDKTSIQIQCVSSNRNSAAQFEKNLKELKFINKAYIPSINQTDLENGKQYSYVIICSIGEVNNDEAE